MKLKKLFKQMWENRPRRIILISGPFPNEQCEQVAKALDKVKKNNAVIVMPGSNETTIKKVWI